MNRCCSFIFVVAFTFLSFGNVLSAPSKSPIVPTTGQICKDGKGPLLEGEDSPFPCADECPEGFMCEHPIEDEPLGICCPNLDILYDLYGKNSAEVDEDLPTLPTTTTTLSTKEVREVSKFASSWQETSEVPEIFTEPLPLIDNNNEDDDKKDTPSPDSHLLKYLKAKELRLSQEKLPIHRSFPMSDPYSNPINPLNPANVPVEEKEQNEIIPTNSNKNKTQIIKPNCKRQKYERSCEKGEKKTQIVLRWFAKNGECCSYPYGYCQGTLVKDDITLRTKEECEIFCLSNATQISSSFETENSPFEMEINNNQVSTSSSNSESEMDSEVNNNTVVDSKLNSVTKAESVEDFVTPPPLTTVSFTDLVLNNNFSTTASFIDLVKSNISAASTTASFIELVLHNNSVVAISDVKMDSKIDSVSKSESLQESTVTPASSTAVTPESSNTITLESSTTVTPKKVNDEKSSTVIQDSYPKNEPVQGSKIPISTPPTPNPSPVNIINSESSYINSDSQTSAINNPPSPQKPQFEPLPPTPSPLFPTLANPIQGDVEGSSGTNELEEVFPPGYGPEIDENNQTRVILHSDIPEPISISPPTDESDAHAKELISEMSESDTSKNNVASKKGDDSNSKKEVLKQEEMEHQKSMNELKTETEATKNIQNENELKVLIKKPLPEFKRTLTLQKVEPKKSCLKVLPYRAMCPSGMPSQFTLRWFVKAGMCCAYPFGYCHGELVFNEEAIKTKKECEELCLGKIDSEKPYHLF